MGARNCARCNTVFEYISGPPLCTSCRNKDEQDFKKVRDYLYENPNATVMEISKGLDVSLKKINRFIKEGRLELKKFKNINLECRSCGTPIDAGEYCDKCKTDLTRSFKNASGGLGKPKDRGVGGHGRSIDGFYSKKKK